MEQPAWLRSSAMPSPDDVRELRKRLGLTGDEWGNERGIWRENAEADRDRDETGALYFNRTQMRHRDEALFLLDVEEGMHVLEMGCGGGHNLTYVHLLGGIPHGQDLFDESVESARERYKHLEIDVDVKLGDCTTLQFDDESMDRVFSFDFHEHLPPEVQVTVLREAWRVLVPGGLLVTKTPNLAYLRLSLNFKRLRALTKLRSPFGLVIPHTPGTSLRPEHVGLVTLPVMRRQLEAAGFQHHRFSYLPLDRFGRRAVIDRLSTEFPVIRDHLVEEVICVARKPIASGFFPE